MRGGWTCECKLCYDAVNGLISREYRWMNFLRHRPDSVIKVDKRDDAPFYVTSSSGKLYFTSEIMDGYKTLSETWREEVSLTEHMKKCAVTVEKRGYKYFSPELVSSQSVNSP